MTKTQLFHAAQKNKKPRNSRPLHCGRWDLNEFPHTVTPHRKELSAHQLIECNQKYNQLVNRLFTLLFNKLELVYFFINEFSVPKL